MNWDAFFRILAVFSALAALGSIIPLVITFIEKDRAWPYFLIAMFAFFAVACATFMGLSS